MTRPARTLWIVGAAAAVKSLLTRLYEPDLWWHLALAREMVAHRGVTRTEVFSYTFAGAPYINFEWLGQLDFYAIWAAFGPPGIFVMKILVALAVAALLAGSLVRFGGTGAATAALWWTAFWTLRPRLNERPELATLLGLPILILLIHRALTRAGAHRGVLVAAFFTTVIWANAHGGWVYGPALAGCLAVGAAWSGKHRGAAPFLLLLSVVLAAAGMVNPYGPKVLFVHTIHLAHLAKAGGVASVIEEWGPTTVRLAPVFWALFAAAAVALVVGLLAGSDAARLWAPAVVVFGVSGAGFYRNAGVFAFVAGPFLAHWMSERRRPRLGAALIAVPALVAVGPAWTAALRPLPSTIIQWQRFPVAACDFLKDENIRGRMFNTLDQGGYIEWALGPERQIFIDGRYLFFPLVKEMADAARAGAMPALLEKYRVDHAVVNYFFFDAVGASPAALFPPKDWALVFWDDAALVYLRRTPVFADVIARREYHAFRPDQPPASVAELKAHYAAEAARHRREVPSSIVRDRLPPALNS